MEEAVASGIEDIIVVTSHAKRAIEDHFDINFELEEHLKAVGKLELLERVKAAEIDIHYIRQKNPMGLGHAVWCARKFIGDEPFAVLLGDDIVRAETPGIRQLMHQYEETGHSVIGVQMVEDEETSRYGIVDPLGHDGRLYEVKEFVEKPAPGEAPSNLAIMGRYVLTPDIFAYLDEHVIGAEGEIQLTDAIQQLNEHSQVYAYDFEGVRYDVGDVMGFLKTTVEFALMDERVGSRFLDYIRSVVEREKN